MKNFFEPVIEKVIQLLNQQVARITGVGKSALLKVCRHFIGGYAEVLTYRLQRILLAGGFGDSPYLHQKVKAWCSTKGLSVLCAEHP